MKRLVLLLIILCWHTLGYAADLLEVYEQALHCDPTFQRAIAQRFATQEGVPISLAALLPNIYFTAKPAITRSAFAGSALIVNAAGLSISPRNNTQRTYNMTLTATQTIFNFAQYASLATQVSISKQAYATLNAALQDLMIRVSKAYFAVLQAEDNLSYSEATKLAYQEQLDQITQQYKVGLKTVTDFYTAQASYDTAVANYIAAQTTLYNSREDLRVITGKYYSNLSSLSENFPLLTPKPANVETWTSIAQCQNWSIKAAQYTVDANRQIVRQQFAGHLPTISVQGTLDRLYSDNINGYNALNPRNGPAVQTDRQIALNIVLPIFSGGAVLAQTNQAVYNYQVAQQSLELTVRNTINTTYQSYNGLIAGISQVNADRQAIKSNISSLEGMEASYRVGTTTLVDVLNQQQKLYQAQTQYAADRYTFVNNILALKQAAGTLGFEDLCGINRWLTNEKPPPVKRKKFNKRH